MIFPLSFQYLYPWLNFFSVSLSLNEREMIDQWPRTSKQYPSFFYGPWFEYFWLITVHWLLTDTRLRVNRNWKGGAAILFESPSRYKGFARGGEIISWESDVARRTGTGNGISVHWSPISRIMIFSYNLRSLPFDGFLLVTFFIAFPLTFHLKILEILQKLLLKL